VQFDILTTIVLPTLFVILAAVVLGRRRAGVGSGEFDSDSVSFAGGVLSALFTVVLAFYIVFAWQTGADIENSAGAESDALIDAYWQADAGPEPTRTAVHGLLREYAATVADREWALLDTGDTDDRIPEIIRELRAAFTALPAGDTGIDLAREQGLRDVRQVDEGHRTRVDLATGDDVFNEVLLGGTVLGAALMIVFPLLVGMSARPANIAVMALLTITISGTVYLSIQLLHPLDGPLGIGPDAFLTALTEMRPAT
jgi:hypothetical protein